MGAAASQDQIARADTQARVTGATDNGINSTLNKSKETSEPVSSASQGNNSTPDKSKETCELVSSETKGNNSIETEPKVDTTVKLESTKDNETQKPESEINTDATSEGDNMSKQSVKPTAPAPVKKEAGMTMDDFKNKEKAALEEAKEGLKEIDEYLAKGDMGKVYEAVHKILKLYFVMYSEPPDFIAEYHEKLGKLVTEHGKCGPIICDCIVKTIKDNNYHATPENKEAQYNYFLIYICTALFQAFSDCSYLFREAYGKQEEVIKLMAEKMCEWAPAHIDGTLSEEDNYITKSFLSIAHNLAMLPQNVNMLRKHKYVEAVTPYLESKTEKYTLSALATLADILNEKECHLLQTNEGSIKFLLLKLGNASKRSDRRDAGWSAAELCRTVRRLARNDGNKKMLVKLGCLPFLLALTTSDIKIEQEESIEALWVLAFDEENQPKMVEEPDLIDTIDELRKTTDGNVKKLCNGILWTLKDVLKVNNKFKHLGTPEDQGHVMISYQWDHQNVIKQISAELKKDKRKVWIDIENMEGSTLQAMANAIEGAKVVICCMSQRYKDSPNCRFEAHYAIQRRRPIIPLIMERGYCPDGWLGIIKGTDLHYDFSGKYSFKSRIDGLLRAVKQIYEAQSEVDCSPRQRQVRTEEDETIKNWTPQQVVSWLKEHNLNGNSKLCKLTGKEIVFLKNLRYEVPELFYHTIGSKLGVTQFGAMVGFTDAIHNLSV